MVTLLYFDPDFTAPHSHGYNPNTEEFCGGWFIDSVHEYWDDALSRSREVSFLGCWGGWVSSDEVLATQLHNRSVILWLCFLTVLYDYIT